MLLSTAALETPCSGCWSKCNHFEGNEELKKNNVIKVRLLLRLDVIKTRFSGYEVLKAFKRYAASSTSPPALAMLHINDPLH